jgi:hypothetical protein
MTEEEAQHRSLLNQVLDALHAQKFKYRISCAFKKLAGVSMHSERHSTVVVDPRQDVIPTLIHETLHCLLTTITCMPWYRNESEIVEVDNETRIRTKRRK